MLVATISSLLSVSSYAQQSRLRKDLPAGLQKKIDATVKKATDYLTKQLKVSKQTGYRSLGVYALMSANEYLEKAVIIDPVCQSVLNHINSKFDDNGFYKPLMGVPVYEAGVDLLALSKAHKHKAIYYSRIQAIVFFLQNDQDPSGFWSYPEGGRDNGDTSQSQYAILGLWAAEELADVRVPSSVWKKAVQWHLDTQYPSGGFAYHPNAGKEGTSLTMAAAGLGSLLICKRVMSGKSRATSTKKKKKRNRKFDDLEQVETGKTDEELAEERKQKQGQNGRAAIAFDSGPMNAAIGSAQGWLNSNFKIPSLRYPLYYIYSIERIGYFNKGKMMFGRDWYVEGAKYLIREQTEEGYWLGGVQKSAAASYGVLFLIRATERIAPTRGLDGGDMRGNSDGMDFSKLRGTTPDGQPILDKRLLDIPKIFSQLEQFGDVDVSKLLIPEIVKEAEFDPKKKKILLKEVKRIKGLLTHSKWQVRQVAVWAMGQTGDIDEVPNLIRALEDINPDVMREAHLALCYISRKPLGPKDKYGKYLPIGPLEKTDKKATQAQKSRTPQQWSREAVDRWNAWYFRVRPYEQRDDLQDSRKKITAKAGKS